MNYSKNPNIARKLAKEQKHLRRIARRDPDSLKGRERAMCEWDIEFENYDEPVRAVSRFVKDDEDEYADFA